MQKKEVKNANKICYVGKEFLFFSLNSSTVTMASGLLASNLYVCDHGAVPFNVYCMACDCCLVRQNLQCAL